jgi:hypothetical protein
MTYNPDVMKIGPTVEEGTRIPGVVIDIKEGKLSEFVSGEITSKWKDADPQQPVINVTMEATHEGNTFRRSQTINLPMGTNCHAKSKMARWIKINKGAPKVGQKIEMMADQNGYFQAFL